MLEKDIITRTLGAGYIPLAMVKQWHESGWLENAMHMNEMLYSYNSDVVKGICAEFGHPYTPLQREDPKENARIIDAGVERMRELYKELGFTLRNLRWLARSPEVIGPRMASPVTLEEKERGSEKRFFVEGKPALKSEFVFVDVDYELNPKRVERLLRTFNEIVAEFKPSIGWWTEAGTIQKSVEPITIPLALIKLAADSERKELAGRLR